jgi:hypothetical protein
MVLPRWKGTWVGRRLCGAAEGDAAGPAACALAPPVVVLRAGGFGYCTTIRGHGVH